MTLSEKIILEYKIETAKAFKRVLPDIYSVIQRDNKHFGSIEEKLELINLIEKYRLGKRTNLPLFQLDPKRLVATQEEVDSSIVFNMKQKHEFFGNEPFVVKLNNVFFLLDGHNRVFGKLSDDVPKIRVRVLDLDKLKSQTHISQP